MGQNESNILQFFSYFEPQLEEIRKVSSNLHKKILICTYLDTLARARYPALNQNRLRFTKLLEEHSQWQDGARVSLPQLNERVVNREIPQGSKMSKFIQDGIRQWGFGNVIRLDRDAEWASVAPHFETAANHKIAHRVTHFQLFYDYRSLLIHEMREPSYGMEITGDDIEPFYMGMRHETRDTWELTYPVAFFLRIASVIAGQLRQHFLQSDIDPYASFRFDSIWGMR